MKIKKIKTKQDISDFLDSLEVGKPFTFGSMCMPYSIELLPNGFYGITDRNRTVIYTRQVAEHEVRHLHKDRINQRLQEKSINRCGGYYVVPNGGKYAIQ